jgi:hypothetical protein
MIHINNNIYNEIKDIKKAVTTEVADYERSDPSERKE